MDTVILISWIQLGILIFALTFLTICVCIFLQKTISALTDSINKFTRKIAKEARKKKKEKE